MKYYIQELQLTKAQRGMIIEAWVSIPTKRQYTNEHHLIKNIEFQEHKSSLSTIVSLFRFWRLLRKEVKRLQSIAGIFELETTCFSKGIGFN